MFMNRTLVSFLTNMHDMAIVTWFDNSDEDAAQLHLCYTHSILLGLVLSRGICKLKPNREDEP